MKPLKTLARYLNFVLILAIPFYILRFKIGPIPSTLLEFLVVLSFLVNLITGSIKIKNKAVFFSALVFALFALIGALVDPQISRGLGLFKAYFFDGILLYLIFSSTNDDLFMPLLSISAAVTSLGALLASNWSIDGRLLGLDGLSPNYLAMFLAPLFVLALYQVILNRYKILNIVCSLIIFIVIVLTGSRGAYIGIIAGLIFIGATLSMKRFSKTKVISVTIALFILLLGGTYAVFRPQANNMGRVGSSSNIRYYIWTTSFEMIGNNPILGVGLGNYQDSFKQLTNGRVNYNEFITPEALSAHNLYLNLYLTTGIFGLLSFLTLLYFAFRQSKNKIALAALIVILVYGLVDTPLFRNDLAASFWIILALL